MSDMILRRVVLDTNVLVAASRSSQGASYALLQALRNRQFIILLSVPLMLEYEAVLKRPEQLAVSIRSQDRGLIFVNVGNVEILPHSMTG